MTDRIDGSGFDGVWYMDKARSRWWDRATDRWIEEPVLAQTLRTVHHDDVFEGWAAVKPREGVVHHLRYRVRFDDREWAPYTCVAIEGEDHSEPTAVLKSGIRVGEPLAYLKQVWVDERTQYRICRNPDATAQYVMMRRLSEDGSTNTGTCLAPDGVTFVSKVFTRDKPADGIDVLGD
jgi:hypothetical protein